MDVYIYIYIYTYIQVKLATVVKGDPNTPLSIATTQRCWGGRYFTLDSYLLMLSVKEGGIKFYF